MNERLSALEPLSFDGLSARLCDAIQGVEFWVLRPSGRRMRCFIAENALQSHYGAADDSRSWLRAFLRHSVDLERRALVAAGKREDAHVVFINDAEGRLRVSAGCCQS